MEQVNFSISEIIEIYNTIPRILANKVTKVNLESYHASSKEKLFTEVTNGSYWIVKTEDGKEWLLPSNKLTVNEHNEKGIQSFFEFQSYDNSENKDFILVEAATVSLLPNASRKEWKLEKLGTLNFDPNHATNKLRSQLKQIESQRDQYQSKLEEIKQEKEQLTAQVAQLASDSLQDIRDSLVTKDELNQQIKILTEESTQLSSSETKENQSVYLSKTDFKKLEESHRKNISRIYKLEQTLEKDNFPKDLVKQLLQKQDDIIAEVNKLNDKIREYEQERESNKSDLLILKERLQNCEKKISEHQKQLNLVPELLIRLEKLERYLTSK